MIVWKIGDIYLKVDIPEMNSRKVLQGRSNYPLNDAGIAQAQKAADELRHVSFTRVYTSPLKRAAQTAEIIAPYAHAVIDDRLIEMDYGPYEGVDLNHLPPEILSFFSDFAHNPAPEGMEQLGSVVENINGTIGVPEEWEISTSATWSQERENSE